MDGTDGLCAFGLAASHTGCEGRLGRIQDGQRNIGHPLVEGDVCEKCAHVVTAVRLHIAEMRAVLGFTPHIATMVRDWVDFCNGVRGTKDSIKSGLAIEKNRVFVEQASRQARMLHNALETLEVGEEEDE